MTLYDNNDYPTQEFIEWLQSVDHGDIDEIAENISELFKQYGRYEYMAIH